MRTIGWKEFWNQRLRRINPSELWVPIVALLDGQTFQVTEKVSGVFEMSDELFAVLNETRTREVFKGSGMDVHYLGSQYDHRRGEPVHFFRSLTFD